MRWLGRADLVRRIDPPDYVAPTVVDHCPTTAHVSCHHHDDGQNCADDADNHQNPAHFVDVETMLIRLRDRPIQDGPHTKSDDTDDKSSSTDHFWLLSICAAIAIPLAPGDKTTPVP